MILRSYPLKDLVRVLACPRAYVCHRIAQLPDPKSPYAQFGIDAHGECEAYLTTGSWLRAPESPEVVAARTAVGYSQLQPGECWGEQTIPFRLCGRDVEAHIDALARDYSRAYDWKFSNSRERWLTGAEAPGGGTLARDLSSLWQAVAVMQASGRTELEYANVYVAPRNPNKAHPAAVRFSYAEALATLEALAQPAFTMLDWFQDSRPELQHTPHDPTACAGARGRVNCAFLGRCQHRPVQPPYPTLVQLRTAAGVIPRATGPVR